MSDEERIYRPKLKAAVEFFPDSASQINEYSDDEEGEEKTNGEQETIYESKAAAPQTSRFEGETILINQIHQEWIDPLTDANRLREMAGTLGDTTGLTPDQVLEAKTKAKRAQYEQEQKVRTDRLIQFVVKIGKLGRMSDELILNSGRNRVLNEMDSVRVTGIADVNETIYHHADEALTMVRMNIEALRPIPNLEAVAFSDCKDFVNMFAKLAANKILISNFLGLARVHLDGNHNRLLAHQQFIMAQLRRFRWSEGKLDVEMDRDDVDSFSGTARFPRTNLGYKRPRYAV
jgi:hypothetical protein